MGSTRRCRRGPMIRARLRDQHIAAAASTKSSRKMRLDIESYGDKRITTHKGGTRGTPSTHSKNSSDFVEALAPLTAFDKDRASNAAQFLKQLDGFS